MQIGYCRVSTTDQNLDFQRDALKIANCGKIFTDQGVSGCALKRPGLDRALAALKPGDTLVVWKLDRLGRSLSHLVNLIAELGKREINFKSLTDPIDTSSASGRLVLHIMSSMAEFERSLIVERTQAGLAAAKKRGAVLGRKRRLTQSQIIHAKWLLDTGESRRTVADSFCIGVATLYRALARERLAESKLIR